MKIQTNFKYSVAKCCTIKILIKTKHKNIENERLKGFQLKFMYSGSNVFFIPDSFSHLYRNLVFKFLNGDILGNNLIFAGTSSCPSSGPFVICLLVHLFVGSGLARLGKCVATAHIQLVKCIKNVTYQDKCRNRINGVNNCFHCVNISLANLHN